MACLTALPQICLDAWRFPDGKPECERRASTLLEQHGAPEYRMSFRGQPYWRCKRHLAEHVIAAGDKTFFVVWQA